MGISEHNQERRPPMARPTGRSLWIPLVTLIAAITITVIMAVTTTATVPPLAHSPTTSTTTPHQVAPPTTQ